MTVPAPQPRMGVYRITHTPSGRTLLGWSMNLNAILNRTRFELQHGSHQNRALLADWKADGADAFTFEILDELKLDRPTDRPLDDLKELLTLWQEKLHIPPAQQY